MVFSGKGEGPVASKSLKWDYRKLTINEGGGREVGHKRMFRHSSDLIVEGYNSSSASISRRDFFFPARQQTFSPWERGCLLRRRRQEALYR